MAVLSKIRSMSLSNCYHSTFFVDWPLILGWASGADSATVDGAWLQALPEAVGAWWLCALPASGAASGVLTVDVGDTRRLWALWFVSGPGSSCVSPEIASVHCVVAPAIKHLILARCIFKPLMLLQLLPQMHSILCVLSPLSWVVSVHQIGVLSGTPRGIFSLWVSMGDVVWAANPPHRSCHPSGCPLSLQLSLPLCSRWSPSMFLVVTGCSRAFQLFIHPLMHNLGHIISVVS